MNADTTPPGIHGSEIEFFVMDGELKFLKGGKIFPWSEVTLDVLVLIRMNLEQDPKALEGLEAMGIINPADQLKQYVYCQFGDFDKKADITADGIFVREYWDCGHRPCPGDGKVCKFPEVLNGKLTPHEAYIIRLICRDIPNKQIAQIMGISTQTVNKECKTIARKLGCYTKIGIARFAGENGIL